MTISQIDSAIWFLAFAVLVGFVVVPVSIYLCVKMGTAAFLITKNRYSKKESNTDERQR